MASQTQHAPPRLARKLRPLGQALVLAGVLTSTLAIANTWTVTLDPLGKIQPPSNAAYQLA